MSTHVLMFTIIAIAVMVLPTRELSIKHPGEHAVGDIRFDWRLILQPFTLRSGQLRYVLFYGQSCAGQD